MSAQQTLTSSMLQSLAGRSLPDGGYAPEAKAERSRPDATAWSALALAVAADDRTAPLEAARSYLARLQRPDGSVCLEDTEPVAFWPTPIALLAWLKAPGFREARERATSFLLETTGVHYPKSAASPMGHDPSLRGWPWNPGTYPWVEPTALALMALDLEGHGSHERCQEAARLLLDRQLTSGGWNYGNTTVYGSELRPLPAETGIALAALEGKVEAQAVADSLAYLERGLAGIRTPLTLAWGILGLSAWQRRPPMSASYVEESLLHQESGFPYSTVELSLLTLAVQATRGLSAVLNSKEAH